MNWTRSATGKTVASKGADRFSIEPLRCWKDGSYVLRFRVRVNGAAIGGVYPTLFVSRAAAKKAVEGGVR